jgi:hypothetical protein
MGTIKFTCGALAGEMSGEKGEQPANPLKLPRILTGGKGCKSFVSVGRNGCF